LIYFNTSEIEKFLNEDVPYFDLTSTLLGLDENEVEISFITREDGIICGTEEILKIFALLHIKPINFLQSGTAVCANTVLISGVGSEYNVNTAWKVGQNILEYASGIATKTNRVVNLAAGIPVYTTRKHFPGTKKMSIKAILSGGALPHRLGLSETILIFKQHINLIGGFDNLLIKLKEIKSKYQSKKMICVETNNFDEAYSLAQAGADIIQFDKVAPDALKEIISKLKESFNVLCYATGGIREDNIQLYADAGVDGFVTTNLYYAKTLDIKVEIKPIGEKLLER